MFSGYEKHKFMISHYLHFLDMLFKKDYFASMLFYYFKGGAKFVITLCLENNAGLNVGNVYNVF